MMQSVRKVPEMQIGHESSTSQTDCTQQLIDGVRPHGRQTENKDGRLVRLDLMIRGQSKVMSSLKKSIVRAADCSSTVLITGESGTGKELIALHSRVGCTATRTIPSY